MPTFGTAEGETRFPDYGPHIAIIGDTPPDDIPYTYRPEDLGIVTSTGTIDNSDWPTAGNPPQPAASRSSAAQATPSNNTPYSDAPTTVVHPRPQTVTVQTSHLIVPTTPPPSRPSTRTVIVTTASSSHSDRVRASLVQIPSTTQEDVTSSTLASSTTTTSGPAATTSAAPAVHSKASIVVSVLLVSLLGVAAVSAFISWLVRVRRRQQLRRFERMSIMNHLHEGATSNTSSDSLEKDVEVGTVDSSYQSTLRPAMPLYPEYSPALHSSSTLQNMSPRLQGRVPVHDGLARSPLHIANLAPGEIYK
ncbi:9636_t:CDS:1, partial [Acaulospora colombiana]